VSKRQHIPMSQREPVIPEWSAKSRDLLAAGRTRRKVWAGDCEQMLHELSDDTDTDFKSLNALSVEDLATLRHLLSQIEGANEQRDRRHRDNLLVMSTVCILMFLFFVLPLIRIFLFGEPPT
jgi:hypothetical protein